MAADSKFLAFDFGAESGRALLCSIKDGKIDLQEVHRFTHRPVMTLGHLHWNVLEQFENIKYGLKLGLEKAGGRVDGVGVDTWGVDFGLLGEDGELLAMPSHYRDTRTDGIMDEVFSIVGREEVFERTGIQFLPFNTLYQLYAMVKSNSTALKHASKLLFMPDLFHYWLTGKQVSEFSIASTSQCYDPRVGDWAYGMLKGLGIQTDMLPKVVQPGTAIGPLVDSLVDEIGAGAGVPVIAPAAHDTGSAVAAVPATGKGHAYISSGTWSLMGVEIDEPMINQKSLAMSFTNEGGVDGKYRFLKNIMGLWLVQECRRTWAAAGENISYADLTAMAENAEGFVSIIDPDDGAFLAPGDMPQRIQDFCARSGQRVPQTKGEIVRCALDSLALRYRYTIECLDEMFGIRHDPIHIVGGGTQNKLLCKLAADTTGRTVVAGPVEATAIGNVLVQAMGVGALKSLDDARRIVIDSCDLERYEAQGSADIDRAYRLFVDLIN
ncbi:MAG: rhamnulokinase [Armatimonadetes bacterium]|nr:rhamnulokinase [Armatimonadota bacterium]